MITQEEAAIILSRYIHEDHLIKHAFAVEAVMRKIAQHLKENEELWGLVGLLHDLDYEYTANKPQNHGIMTAEILQDLLPKNAIQSIKSHNYIHTNILPINIMDKALLASDAISDLIIATSHVISNKKLIEVTPTTLKQKFNDSSFAKTCDRDLIKLCEDFGIELEEFFTLSLAALKEISNKLE